MDLGKIVEKLKEWAQKLIEILLGPPEPEAELIPIPVNERHREQRR